MNEAGGASGGGGGGGGDWDGWREVAVDVLGKAVIVGLSYLAVSYMLKRLHPDYERKKESIEKATKLIQDLDRVDLKETLQLDDYEWIIASDIVVPGELDASFSDVGGLSDTKTSIAEAVIFPMSRPDLFSSNSLLGLTRGILLWGPPGCGKTMLAKAVAKQCGVTFINLQLSTLMDKYYGESQKLARAVFSLAEKLEPTIIFLDEIDCLFGKETHNTHPATSQMRAQFLTLWDGLKTSKDSKVVVIGATNNRDTIDPAILRRMPRQFHIPLPDVQQRAEILGLVLAQQKVDTSLNLQTLAELTSYYSGSDLKELCKAALLIPMRELLSADPNAKSTDFRPLRLSDFIKAKEIVGPTAQPYTPPVDENAAMLQLLSSLGSTRK